MCVEKGPNFVPTIEKRQLGRPMSRW
jgi:hypothetical protein